MKVDTQTYGKVGVVTPHGPLVTEEAEAFRRAVDRARELKAGRVVIDMRNVAYLDSVGIETLLDLWSDRPRETGAGTRLARLTDTCREALDLTDALPRIEVFDSVQNAIRSFNQ